MNLETALKGISEHRARLDGSWDSPEALSDIAIKLVTYNSYLSEYVPQLHKEATDKAYQVYLEVIGKGEGVTKADTMSRGESTKEREAYEKAKFIYQSTGNLVSFIQTKIKVNMAQRQQES